MTHIRRAAVLLAFTAVVSWLPPTCQGRDAIHVGTIETFRRGTEVPLDRISRSSERRLGGNEGKETSPAEERSSAIRPRQAGPKRNSFSTGVAEARSAAVRPRQAARERNSFSAGIAGARSAAVRLVVATPDTIHHRIDAGRILIVALPEAVAGRAVTRYEIVRAPALSWLVGRSFMWRTTRADAGGHAVLFRAHFEEDVGPDSLVLVVLVE